MIEKCLPLANASCSVLRLESVTIINYVNPYLSDEAVSLTVIYLFRHSPLRMLYDLSVKGGSNAKIIDGIMSVLAHISAANWGSGGIYLYASTKSDILETIKTMRELRKERKKKKRPKKSTRRYITLGKGITEFSPLINATAAAEGKYIFGAEINFHPLKLKGRKTWTSLFVYISLYQKEYGNLKSFRDFITAYGFFHLGGMAALYLTIVADSKEDLLAQIEEKMSEWHKEQRLTDDVLYRTIVNIYADPVALTLLCMTKEPLPTLTELRKNRNYYEKAVAEYRKNIYELVARCEYIMRLPPLRTEEIAYLQREIEVLISPRIVEQKLAIRRINGSNAHKGKEDEIWNILLERLPEEGVTFRKNGSEMIFEYGHLMDIGQVLTYGQMLSLSSRLYKLSDD